jgi:hypothetical protein
MHRFPVLLLLLALPVSAQDPAAASPLDTAGARITADSLKAHLTVIAADAFEGRNSGFPGNDKTAEYVAAHFKKIGLRPAGEKDALGDVSWFQSFKVGERATRNVLGMAEGSDPELKSEIVVIGAHHDHVGKDGEPSAGRMKNSRGDPEDKIWNGADDNGSGTVTVLEIARAFMEGKIRTKRSVLFMTFSGEEWGLIGSKYYVDHPLHPLSKIAAMINLDMVGRNGTKPMDVGGVGTAADWVALCEEAAKGTGLAYTTSAGVMPGSDHYSFARRKIPAVHFFTGFHGDYHCQTDHADKIEYERMAKIGRFGLRLLALTADRVPRLAYTGPAGPRLLGIEAEEITEEEAGTLSLPEGEGGLRIEKVSPESAAARAGVKEGDILVAFNGKNLPLEDPLVMLRKELKTVKDGIKVPISVIREGKRVDLHALWGKASY